ncbi:hypothetical protein BGX38DRAFT_1180004 [Terfezia claveryi]|nr:hypothetical protein BGX38DRAFT_1180004 [Terfezia claveryi]
MPSPISNLMEHIPPYLSLSLPAPTTTKHVTIYLLFLVLSSISLFVFLNSTISFIISDILEIRGGEHLGNIVGTLGFVDEIIVIVSAPVWGIVSDRWGWGGRKGVTALGFVIAAAGLVGLSEAGLVKGKNGNGEGFELEGWEWWYWMILWRAVFAIGGGAISTMISAVLPDLTSPPAPTQFSNPISTVLPPPHPHVHGAPLSPPSSRFPHSPGITRPPTSPSSKLAGIVGLFSGLGALLALSVFLPLPTLLDPSRHSTSPTHAKVNATGTGVGLKRSYWAVATYAVVCGTACWFGLPHYGEESPKRRMRSGGGLLSGKISRWWRPLFGKRDAATSDEAEGLLQERSRRDNRPSASRMLIRALKVGHDRWRTIGISYIGGFIARASSVGLSLFIPLFVNHYFITHGLCSPRTNPSDNEEQCRRAYIVAAILTGVSQLVGLISAPLIGYLSSSASSTQPATSPLRVLSITSLLGTIGFIGFGFLDTPDVGFLSLISSALLGVGQIGAVVGSLGLLGRGQGEEFDTDFEPDSQDVLADAVSSDEDDDGDLESPRHRGNIRSPSSSSSNPGELKGTIAGVYSLCGGMGILFLTKGGGLLFDKWSPGAPFWVLGSFMGGFAVLTGVEGWVRGS